jgi:predicted RND superfamily exporter protein
VTRAALLSRLERDLKQHFKLSADDYRVSGTYVIYAGMADLLPPTLVMVGALAALASLALVIVSGRTPRAASRLLTPTLIAALGVMGVAGWHSLRLDVMTVCASAVAFALFVQIRTAGRRLIEAPDAAAIKAGTAPPPVRDPYGSTVIGLGTVSVGAGLATLGTAAFAPTAHFGILCGAMVVLALLASQRVSGLRRRFD